MPNDRKRVLIIGGGIAGPAVALFLKEAGFSPQIFEANTGPDAAGGALGVAPNGMNVLSAGGVSEQVRDVGVTGDEWVFENQSGDVLASSSAGDAARYGQPAVMITRRALHDVLLARAEEREIPIYLNKSAVG